MTVQGPVKKLQPDGMSHGGGGGGTSKTGKPHGVVARTVREERMCRTRRRSQALNQKPRLKWGPLDAARPNEGHPGTSGRTTVETVVCMFPLSSCESMTSSHTNSMFARPVFSILVVPTCTVLPRGRKTQTRHVSWVHALEGDHTR